MRFFATTMMIGALAGIVDAAPATRPAAPSPQTTYRQNYAVVYEKSIFLRDRSRPVTTRPAASTRPAPQSVEQSFVLAGVVLEDGQPRAYFEDRAAGQLVKVGVGEALGHGRIVLIDIDAVAYERDARLTWVGVGSDLTGALALVSAAPTTAASEGVASGSGSGAASGSVAERMRARRAAEQRRR